MPFLPFPAPAPLPATPSAVYAISLPAAAAGDPVVYSGTGSAGPDESFFLVGNHLGNRLRLWGPGRTSPSLETTLKTDSAAGSYVIATMPENIPDGLFVGVVGDGARWSAPFRLNAPQPWWCGPDRASPGEPVDIFGDELAERPDRVQSCIYVENPGHGGAWASTTSVSRYRVTIKAPRAPGHYNVWVHAGAGGAYGWGGPVPLEVHPAAPAAPPARPVSEGANIQKSVNASKKAGAVVSLGAGTYWLDHTLTVPGGVTLQGASESTTFIRLRPQSPDSSVISLSDSAASIRNLTVIGAPQTSTGVAVGRDDRPVVEDIRIEGVRVAGIEGGGDDSAVRIRNARYVTVRGCDLTGRTPLYLQGMSQSRLAHNWLHSVTRWGGNAEAAILGRTSALHQNVIEDNIVDSPENGGGPTARRLLWLSTGQGSVSENYIAGNIGRTSFGGVAGTDQNVGETILFETNMRIAYYGHPRGASVSGVDLPASGPFIPPVGSGAHQASGVSEPPQDEYYVYVVRGTGLGQVRRVIGRRGGTLLLDAPWSVPPDADSMVLEALTFARNIVVGNQVSDGMSGIQLWIGGYRNIFAENSIENERREGIYLFGAMSTAQATMINRWNSGIGPLFYNSVEGNRITQTQQGILLGIGDDAVAAKGADWPRALGTVIRHNTVTESRTPGIELSAGSSSGPGDLAIMGTLVDFNTVRDSPLAYSASDRSIGTLFRRDFTYFWNERPGTPLRAFSTAGAVGVIGDQNVIEGQSGSDDVRITSDIGGSR